MNESHLFNPSGDLVGILPHDADSEAIVRLAYGLDERDVLSSTSDALDVWHLTITLLAEMPAGNRLRHLPFSIRDGAVPLSEVTVRLAEMAVLDLWDKGWRIVAVEG
jgi:hypothetical protein